MLKKYLIASVLVFSFMFAGVSAFAATTPVDNTAKIACVGTAVATREASLDAGFATYTKAVSDAYSARATALAGAYTGSSTVAVKAAVKTAWTTFRASVKTAQTSWKSTKASATFGTAAKACKAPTTVNDNANKTSEI